MKKLLLLLALLLPTPAWSATHYVSNSGNNANSCAAAQNISTPKQTINNFLANCSLAGGDTLLIRGGTYTEYVIILNLSGSAGNLITISSYQNEIVTIRAPSGLSAALEIYDSDYLQVISGTQGTRNMIMDCFDVEGATCVNIIQQDSTNIRLRDMEIKDTGRGLCGVNNFNCPAGGHENGLAAGGTNHEFINLWIHDNGVDHFDHGMYVAGNDNLIENCVLNRNAGWGVHKYDSGDRWTIRGNTIFANGQSYYSGAVTGAGEGILLYGGTDSIIYNNVIYNNASAAITLEAETNTEIYFNTVYGNAVQNNTAGIYDLTNDAIIRNNISFANAGPAIVGGLTLSNNLTTDPDFVNAAGADFHLLDTSDALGAGVTVAGITTDHDDVTRPNPPSIGAYETPSGSDPLDPLVENFDAYTTSASISGLNGGSGWTASWVLTAGTVTVETAPPWMSGKSLRQNTASYAEAARAFTAHTGAFTISFKLSLSAIPNDYVIIALYDQAGGDQAYISFDSFGDVIDFTNTLVSGFSLNTAYSADIDFDTVNQPGKFRTRVNGGAYTPWSNTQGPFTSIAGLRLYSYATNAHTFWLDDIDGDAADTSCAISVGAPPANSIAFRPNTTSIAWTAPGCSGDVTIQASWDGGTTWLPAFATVAHDSSPYTWDTVIGRGSNVKIRVCSGGNCGTSEAFTVFGEFLR